MFKSVSLIGRSLSGVSLSSGGLEAKVFFPWKVNVREVNVVAPFYCVVAGDNAGVEVVRGTGPESIATSPVRRLVAKWNSTFQRSKQNDLHIR